MKTFVIAEAGSCHEGSLEKAKRLIDLAHAAGADACKFQYCSNYRQFMVRRRLPTLPERFSIEREWIPYLEGFCSGHKIEFMCSTYLPEDIEVVAPYVKRFKISNFESGDSDFINKHWPYEKPVLVSGRNLHCVSLYPCPDDKAKLRKVGDNYGLSDHTKNPLSGALAVALGADYIETHFRLNDTSKDCPDYEVARTPQELHDYIRNIRQAEILLG